MDSHSSISFGLKLFILNLISLVIKVCLAYCFFSSTAYAVIYTVNTNTDVNPNVNGGFNANGIGAGVGAGTTGDLRYCINQANTAAGNSVVFSNALNNQTITLAGPLTPIQQSMTFNNNATNLTINGAADFTAFFVYSGNVTINGAGLIVTNTASIGGNGGPGKTGGGGGLGCGGGLFVNTGSTVICNDVNFVATGGPNRATGGNGGGVIVLPSNAGGGGGGILNNAIGANGGAANLNTVNGGVGGGGGGVGGSGGATNGSGASGIILGAASGGNNSAGTQLGGSNGGGGGGGTNAVGNVTAGGGGVGGFNNGNGGFGGGGGGNGGNGGFGGGGGGQGNNINLGIGGFGGGNGATAANTGGNPGSGYGGAVFARTGSTLTIGTSTAATANVNITGNTMKNGNGGAVLNNDIFMNSLDITINVESQTLTVNNIRDDNGVAHGAAPGDYTAGAGTGGGIFKTGSGTLALPNANNYVGSSTLNGGNVLVGNAGSLGTTGSVFLNTVTLQSSAAVTLPNPVFVNTNNVIIGGTNNLALSGAVTVNGNLNINNTAITGFTGTLSGAGGIIVNTGTTTLGGVSTYSGNTMINGGIVQAQAATNNTFSPNSSVFMSTAATFALNSTTQTIKDLSGFGIVSLGAGVLNTGGQNTSTTYSGSISGAGGSLIKNGSGTFVLNGANTYSGGTVINGGTLIIGFPNSLSPVGNISVNNSGILNVGALSLNTTGNYTQGGNAGFATTLINPTTFGSLTLNGNATLADGAFIYVTSGNGVSVNDFYSIITANTAPNVNVNALRIIPVNGPFRYKAFIIGRSLVLQVMESNYLFNLASGDPNAQAIAAALEIAQFQVPFTSDLFMVIHALDQLPPNQVLAALQSLEPDITTGPQITTRSVAELAFQEIDNRLDYLRDRRHASAYDMQAVSHQLKRGYKAGDPWNDASNEQMDGEVNGSLGPFLIGNSLKQVTRVYQFGYNAQTGGVGYINDVALKDSSCLQLDYGRFGVGGTYTGSSVRSKNPNEAKTTILSPQVLAYAYAEKSFFFSDIAIGLSRNWYEEERLINFGPINRRASAKYTGWQYGGRARLGYCLARDLFETTPMAILQYTHLNLSGYTEKGADSLNLMVSKQKFSSMRGALGVRIAYTADKCNYLPEIRIFYFRDLNEPKIDLTGQFTGGGPAFKQHNPILSRNSIVFGLGVTTNINTSIMKDFYMSLNFDGERKENYRDYSGRASIWWIFD